MGWGDLPDLFGPKKTKKKRGRGRVSPTGPYRAESGNKQIRSKASSAERRKFSHGSTPTATRARKLERKDRREAAQAKRDAAKAATAVTKAKASRPIETLRKAEAKLARKPDPKLREATRRLRHALASEATFKAGRGTPEGTAIKANQPDKALKSVAPRAYKKAHELASPGGHGSSKGLGEPEDLTTAITLAAPGSGLAGRAVSKGLEVGGEKLAAALAKRGAAKVASEAEQSAAEAAAKSAAERIRVKAGNHVRAKAESVKTSPARAARRVRETPRRVREAPARARRAATTKAGRRAAARKAARSAARHPIRSGGAGLAVLPVKPEGGGVLPGDPLNRLSAFGKGELAAALHHPGKYAETTAHAGLGALAYPLVLGGAGVASIKKGSPQPLIEQGERAISGTKKMVGDLASGNPKRVEENALQESGAVPFIPVPAVLRRLKGTKAYEDARAAARAAVEGKRAPKREAAIAADKAAQVAGDYRSRRSQRKITRSAPVPDTARPGEHYVHRTLGRAIEKQRSRHRIAREFARITHEESQAHKAVEEIAKPLRKSKATTQKDRTDLSTALRIVGRYGLPHNEAKGMAFVERLHNGWPKGEAGKSPGGIALDRHATAYIISHPEIFRNPKFWESVARLDKLQKEVATSPRHQFMAQLDQLVNPIRHDEGLPRFLGPHEMVTPEALKLLPKKDTGALLPSQVKELKAVKELERRGLVPKGSAPNGGHLAVAERPKPVGEWSRSEAYDYLKQLQRSKNGSDQARAAQLQNALEDAGNGKRLMKPPEHEGPEHGVSTTQAERWTPEMLQRHLKQIKPELKRLGLREPTPYLADVLPSKMPGGEPSYGTGLPRAVHASQGLAAKSGNAIASFDQMLHHSAVLPRRRAAMVTGLNRIFDHFSRKVGGHRYLTRSQVDKAINNHEWPPGTVPVRTQMLRSLLEGDTPASEGEFKQALAAELEHGQALLGGGKEELRAAMEAAKANGVKGEKFAPMDAVAIHELMGHLEGPGAVTKWFGHASNFATRTILNSIAFEKSQFFQEGVPGAIALGRDVVHIPAAIKQIKEINNLPIAEQNRVRAVMGASVGLRGAPNIKQAEGFLDPVRAAAPKQAWRHVWEIANGSKISRFDIARSGKFREVAALARIEGDLKRANKGFEGWRHSSRNLFKNELQAIEDMKGMNGGERGLYIAEHPRLGDNVVKDMRGILGNWDAFTVFEKHVAPFAIFYPFQRFSALWTLYHFPLDHPAAATAIALLGAVNAAEVKKAAEAEGGEPSALDYTKPVINGKSILPAGQRFSTGLGAIQQAALEHKPMQALQGLNPAFQIPVEALAGKNAYTGQPLGEPGVEYLARQGANLSPFLRFLGIPDIGKGKSPGSQAFAQEDPLKQERSFWEPLTGQSVQQFAKEKRLEKDFRDKYGEGNIPGPFDSQMVIDLLYGGKNGQPQPELLPHVLRKIHEAEAAGERVKRAEAPFLPKSKPFSPLQKELLQAVEDAWETGPAATQGGKYAGTLAKKPLPGQGKYGGAFSGSASSGAGKYSGAFGG